MRSEEEIQKIYDELERDYLQLLQNMDSARALAKEHGCSEFPKLLEAVFRLGQGGFIISKHLLKYILDESTPFELFLGKVNESLDDFRQLWGTDGWLISINKKHCPSISEEGKCMLKTSEGKTCSEDICLVKSLKS